MSSPSKEPLPRLSWCLEKVEEARRVFELEEKKMVEELGIGFNPQHA